MANCKIEFLPEAYKDLNEIFDYILLDSPANAQATLDKIIYSIEKLETFPLLGKQLINEYLNYYQFRMIIVKPYIVFYRFLHDKIYIYRILHGASDYMTILKDIWYQKARMIIH